MSIHLPSFVSIAQGVKTAEAAEIARNVQDASSRVRAGVLFAALLAAVSLASCVWASAFAAGQAWAESAAFDGGASESYMEENRETGNMIALNREVTGKSIETDLYWAGKDLDARDLEVGAGGNGSALLAGRSVSVAASKVNGSLRAAAQEIVLDDVAVLNNITVAGQTVTVGAGTSARAVWASASEVTFAGSAKDLDVAAGTANVTGKVEGDATIDADTVIVGKDAKIAGVLVVPEDCQLTVEDGANAPNVQRADLSGSNGFSATGVASQAGIPSVFMMVLAVVAHCLLALLFWWLARRQFEIMAVVTRDRLSWVSLFGVVAFLACPVLVILLIVPVVTAPVAALLVLFMIATWLFAIPLSACALGIRLGKGKHALGMAMAITVFLTVLTYIPGLFLIVPSLCAAYVVGCWVQMVYLSKKAIRVPA